MCTSYARDLELSKQKERELSDKKSKANKMKVRSEEFETRSSKGKVVHSSKASYFQVLD